MNKEDTLTADTLLDGARMYAAAADAVNNKLPNSFHVLSHLMATSIELALKAYLRKNGYSERQLKSLGHNLKVLLDKACTLGFEYTGSRNFVLYVSGYIYKQRLFVYPENCNLNTILPKRLRQMVDEIIREVFILLYGEEEYNNSSNKQGLFIDSSYPDDLDASNWSKTT